jgi:excisionase family DNA binding protein
MSKSISEILNGLTTTVPLAGKVLGLSRNKAYEAVAKGEIPALRFGKRIVVPTVPLKRMLGLENLPKNREDP